MPVSALTCRDDFKTPWAQFGGLVILACCGYDYVDAKIGYSTYGGRDIYSSKFDGEGRVKFLL